MNPKRLDAYHRLIRKLLAHPHQAAKILDNQPTLVDTRLLMLMEQVSNRLKVRGLSEKAYFLKSLGAELKDELMPIVNKKKGNSSPQINESRPSSKFRTTRFGKGKARNFQGKESSINWDSEWQKFNLRAKKISNRSRYKKKNYSQVKGKKISTFSQWISLLMLIFFLIISGGVFWYRLSGKPLFGDYGESNYTFDRWKIF